MIDLAAHAADGSGAGVDAMPGRARHSPLTPA
jgi:hypothetical protein